MRSLTSLISFAILALSAGSAAAQSLNGCGVLPANNVWNTPIDTLPVHLSSAAWVNTVGAAKALHPDFSNAGGYGIPFVVVPGTQAKVPVSFTYADESDPGPYPVPANAPIEGGASSSGDRHVLVLESAGCVLYELYSAYPQADGSWKAGSGAVFDLKSNALRPAGWTSADAAGLPILPGLVRYDEVASGEIRHAIRMTAPQTLNAYIWPARHKASSLAGAQYPPMGARFRLKASFDITPYPADVQVILKALKKYGALLADNGSSWYLSGAPDSRWNDDTLHKLGQVLGSNFEVADESGLMVDPNSGAVSTTVALSAVQLNPAQLTGGASSAQNQVVLSGPAPAGGVTVSLSSSDFAAASLPASVVVAGGASTAPFTIVTTAVYTATPVTISAFYLGVTKSATLTVNPPAPQTGYSLQAPATAKRRATVAVQWTAPSGHSAADYVALYTAAGTSYWSSTTGSGTAGSFSVQMPRSGGQYYFRLVRADGTFAAQSAITVR